LERDSTRYLNMEGDKTGGELPHSPYTSVFRFSR
jgi:hypothetical protein